MPLRVLKGNLFTSSAQTLVNTINCVGVMGAGVAFEFRLRYPQMFEEYVELCRLGKIAIGSLWLFRADRHWVLNFPTKTHWKLPSKLQYLEKGLEKFVDCYLDMGIRSAAFPVLGAGNGGVPEGKSIEIMERYLQRCSIDIQIYRYDPKAADDLFLLFQEEFALLSDSYISGATGIRSREIGAIRRALGQSRYRTMSQLLSAPGVGEKTLERCFKLANKIDSYKSYRQIGLDI